MANEHYNAAVKLGEKAYREALAKGEPTGLPVLEEILKDLPQAREMKIGIYEVPIDRIVGTYTDARKTAFAPNFMPLPTAGQEFSDKWSLLCEAHLNEGISDPIKVYEYMNRFYVMEGNKRVSVFKYFGAASIPGDVIRILPPKTDSKESRVYYEYLNFFKLCPTLDLVFSEPGSYWLFQAMAHKKPHESWTHDEQLDLRSLIARFDDAYEAMNDDELISVSSSDALLTFLHFYRYERAVNYTPAQMKRRLDRIRHELHLISEDDEIEMVLDAEAGEEKTFLEKLFSGAEKKLKIAFIYSRSPEESGWTYGHELGRQYLEEHFKDSLETRVYQTPSPINGMEDVINEAISDGANVIFATSPLFTNPAVKVAATHPDVKILVCGNNLRHMYIRTYYTRAYESKFLSGMIAGITAEDDKIGYLTDYPIYSNIASLNAFALGVQAVNPNAKVHVQWTKEKDADPEFYFRTHEIHVISGMDLTAPRESMIQGLCRMVNNKPETLALTVIDWGKLYRKLIESIQNGRWESVEKSSHGKPLNYWFGFSDDVIDLVISPKLPPREQNLIRFMRSCLRDGTFRVFRGLIRDQQGNQITSSDNDSLAPMDIAEMNWLNENIVGRVPTLNELTEGSGLLVIMQGNAPLPGKETR